jgi:hypothetical protein
LIISSTIKSAISLSYSFNLIDSIHSFAFSIDREVMSLILKSFILTDNACSFSLLPPQRSQALFPKNFLLYSFARSEVEDSYLLQIFVANPSMLLCLTYVAVLVINL